MRVNANATTYRLEETPKDFEEARVSSSKGVVTVEAGSGNDEIRVSAGKDRGVDVSVNGETFHFARSEVEKGLVIKGGSGKDFFRVDESVDVPVRLEGGKGNDSLLNRAKGTVIDGGDDNDTIVNAGANATIIPGEGDNLVKSYGDGTTIDRQGSGRDRIEVAANDTFVRSGSGGVAEVDLAGHGNYVRGHDNLFVRYFFAYP